MNKYTILFEMFDRKMKITVDASNEEHAKELVADRIIFHKITLVENNNAKCNNDNYTKLISNDPIVNKLADVLGMNKPKPRKK